MFDDIAVTELAEYGVRPSVRSTATRALRRRLGALSILALSGESGELAVDTPSALPQHAVFAMTDAGAMWSKLDDEPWVQVEHGLVIAPLGVSRRLRFAGGWRTVVVYVPREVLTSFVPALPGHVQFVADRRVLDIAFESFLKALVRAGRSSSAIEDYAIEQLIMEMCGAVLLDRTGVVTGRGSPHDVLRDRALAVIAQQCADADLTPELVAHQVQSSLRQLQLVFAEAGNSVAVEIRRQRARLARSVLSESRFDVLSVEQVAHRSGFRSAMSLRRALDEFYGTTPREVRMVRHSRPAQ